MTVKFQLKGIEETNRALAQLDQKIRAKVVRTATRKGTNVILKAVRDETPVDSGALKRAARTTVDRAKSRDGFVGTVAVRKGKGITAGRGRSRYVRVPSKYMHLVTGGTKPHAIGPKRSKGMSFRNIVRRRVNHPGTAANDYFGRAADRSHTAAMAEFTREYKRGVEIATRESSTQGAQP